MTELVLAFEEYPDFEATVRLAPCSVDELEAVIELYEAGLDVLPKRLRELYARWAPQFLVAWTSEHPVSDKGMGKLDANLTLALVQGWIMGVRRAPLPLPRTPSASTTSAEGSPPASPEPAGSETS